MKCAKIINVSFGVMILAVVFAADLRAQDSETYFRQNCMSCHTIGGGRLTGPDLKDVSKRQEGAWLLRFMMDPKAVIDSGDPYAQKLLSDYGGTVMPKVSGLDRGMAEALLKLIERESAMETSQFKGIQISDRPFTAQDVAHGRDLFLGRVKLKNGGPTCISCHSVSQLGLFGGGKLGPELTGVYERLEGRKSLATWLSAPATPTMQATFRNHALEADEVLALTAYFNDINGKRLDSPAAQSANMTLAGLIVSGIILLLFDRLWRQRFRGVRRPIVHGNQRGE